MTEQQVQILIELLESVEKKQESQGQAIKELIQTMSLESKNRDDGDLNTLTKRLDELLHDNRQQDSRLHKSIVQSFREEIKSINYERNGGSTKIKLVLLLLIGALLFGAYKFYSLYKENTDAVMNTKIEVIRELYNSKESNKKRALKAYDTSIYENVDNEKE